MLNPQLLNNLGDFFSTFKEVVTLATNPEKLDTIIAGLDDAKAVIAQHAAAQSDLDELATFKTTKAKQLSDIADAQAAIDEAAKLNTDQAKALQDAEASFTDDKATFATQVSDLQKQAAAVASRESAVQSAEQDVKDTQAAADLALADANTLKQSYVAKLQALAQTEGGDDGTSGT